MTGNVEQIDYWDGIAGPKWVAGQERLDQLMAPLTTALLAAAAIRPGETVLDIGCGCGDTALRAAAAAGPRGRVVALDVSRPMLQRARSRAAALVEAAPVEWRLADASATVLAGDGDVALSRFGVMFFADPIAAFANIRGGLRPGGRIAFLTWQRHEEVEWMYEPVGWLGPRDAPAGDAGYGPGPFAHGDADSGRAMLERAGFRSVEVRAIRCSLHLGDDPAEAAALLMEHGPAAHAVREGSPALRAMAGERLRARLAAYSTGAGVKMGAACWLYAASA